MSTDSISGNTAQVIFVGPRTSVRAVSRCLREASGKSVVVDVSQPRRNWPGIPAPVLRLEDYAPNRKTVWDEMGPWLHAWSNQPVCSGLNIKQALIYRGMSVWWLMDIWLLWCNILPRKLEDVLYDLEAVKSVLEKFNPEQVVSLHPSADFNGIVEACCRALGVQFHVPPHFGGDLRWRLRIRTFQASHWGRFIARKLVQSVQRPFLGKSGCPPLPVDARKVLIVLRDDWELVLDMASGRLKNGDRHYQTIIDSIAGEFAVQVAGHLHSFRMRLKSPREKRKRPAEFEPLETYASIADVYGGCRELRQQWQRVRGSDKLWESMVYKGVPFGELMRPRFDAFFDTGVVEALIGVEAAHALFEAKPDLLLHSLETSAVGKAFLHFARATGVPSLVLQHGTITEGHAAGTPDPSEVDLEYPNVCAWPFPDRMAVYGQASKRALLNSHWPPQLVCPSGAPRWDFLAQPERFFNRDQTCRRIGLDPQLPVVLFLGSDYGPEDTRAVMEAVCLAVRQVKDCQLVIKLKAFDRYEYVTREVLKQHGMESVPLFKNCTPYELMYASDIEVAVGSTTVVEAALIGRPTILIDPLRQGYSALFEDAFVKSASTADQLADLLFRYFHDDAFRRRWMDLREPFVSEQCYRADGRSTERVVKIMREMIAGNTGALNIAASAEDDLMPVCATVAPADGQKVHI